MNDYVWKDGEFEQVVEVQRNSMSKDMVNRLVAYRKKMKMTQQDIADITGIQRPNIARFEAGTHTPTMDVLIKYATAVGMDMVVDFQERSKSLKD